MDTSIPGEALAGKGQSDLRVRKLHDSRERLNGIRGVRGSIPLPRRYREKESPEQSISQLDDCC